MKKQLKEEKERNNLLNKEIKELQKKQEDKEKEINIKMKEFQNNSYMKKIIDLNDEL